MDNNNDGVKETCTGAKLYKHTKEESCSTNPNTCACDKDENTADCPKNYVDKKGEICVDRAYNINECDLGRGYLYDYEEINAPYAVGSWCDLNNCWQYDNNPDLDLLEALTYHYCSYGENDNTDTGENGVCCPTGTTWDDFQQTCLETEQCHPQPPGTCASDYVTEFTQWTQDQNCLDTTGATACCEKIKFGEYKYYSDTGNIKTY